MNNVLAVATLRNCAKTITEDIRVVESAFPENISIEFLLIESDSEDETLDVLESLKSKRSSIEFVSLGYLRDKYPTREDRLAFCRNQYLRQLNGNTRYEHIDTLFVFDADGINRSLSRASIESCLALSHHWDAIFPNQNAPYHDIYALRKQGWIAEDYNLELEFMKEIGMGYIERLNRALYRKMIRIPSESACIVVESAFGGCAIYRREAIANACYSGYDDKGRRCCEHVSFNRGIRKNGFRALMINPGFINSGINEHNFFATWFGQIVLVIKGAIIEVLVRS